MVRLPLLQHGRPLGMAWRSSAWYVTLVVGLGIATDVLVYSLPVAVIPFQLGKLGYTELSSLTGWLLFAYAIGLIFSTPPVVWLSERYYARRFPLLFGLMCLEGSLIMFMLAPNYAVMVVARVLQGISSTIVWVVGVALICDTVPTEKVGQYLGTALTGLSFGMVAGPPLGGVLYQQFGFHGPFIFGIIVAFVDLVARIVVVEHKVVMKWEAADRANARTSPNPPEPKSEKSAEVAASPPSLSQPPTPLPPIARPKSWPAIMSLLRSTKAMTACFNTLIYGFVFSGLDATLSLRLWDVYGFDSEKVGIVYIAAVVPTVFSSVIAGWASDKWGTKWISVTCQILSIPWFVLLLIDGPLGLFIACLALGSFFVSGVVSPIMADLAAVSRELDDVGYAHVYGLFNLSFSISTAVGPIVASQMYDHVPGGKGWLGVCLFLSACLGSAVIPTALFSGSSGPKEEATTASMEQEEVDTMEV